MKKQQELKMKCESIEEKIHKMIRAGQKAGKSFDEVYKSEACNKLKAAKREAEKEFKYWERREIQEFCNMVLWTDVHPYEVIKVVSDKCVEIRPMKAELVKAPKDFHAGGFCGHYSDNYAQEWRYEMNPEASVQRVRWSEAKQQWQAAGGTRFVMSNAPRKFHDYNF